MDFCSGGIESTAVVILERKDEDGEVGTKTETLPPDRRRVRAGGASAGGAKSPDLKDTDRSAAVRAGLHALHP